MVLPQWPPTPCAGESPPAFVRFALSRLFDQLDREEQKVVAGVKAAAFNHRAGKQSGWPAAGKGRMGGLSGECLGL